METMRAVMVDPSNTGKLSIGQVAAPSPKRTEALVRVAAVSLNRGEVRGAMSGSGNSRPGSDLAGVVEQAAADGSGPHQGERVVGFVSSGAWAELAAVPTRSLAPLPEAVSFAQAATLPVAGLAALHAVEKATGLLARKALVTGASGGVGLFACQIARVAGARVVGLVRQRSHAAAVEEAGAEQVVVSADGTDAGAFGPYRLVVESVGGQVLANALGMLAPYGVCVSFGATSSAEVNFNLWSLTRPGGASLYGMLLQNELKVETAAVGLERLAYLVSAGQLRPQIAVEASWTEIAAVAQQLMDRSFAGKAVLHVDSPSG